MTRVALVYKDFQKIKVGVSHVGLGVSSINTAAVLLENGINAIAVPVMCFEDVLLYLSNNKDTTHVAIQALWVSVKDLETLLTTFPNIKFTCVCHSNIGFLSTEPAAIKLLRDYKAIHEKYWNFAIAGNSEKFIEAWTRMYDVSVKYIPNLYNLGKRKSYKFTPENEAIKIGCFGAIRPLKNFVSAIAACIDMSVRLNREVTIFINSGREEGGSVTSRAIDELVAGLTRVKLVKTLWSDHSSFKKIVGEMDLLIQPSFSESFNMVTADGVSQSVPSVVSDAITWTPKAWIAKADNVSDIAFIGIELLKNRSEQIELGRLHLLEYVRNGISHWERWLRS